MWTRNVRNGTGSSSLRLPVLCFLALSSVKRPLIGEVTQANTCIHSSSRRKCLITEWVTQTRFCSLLHGCFWESCPLGWPLVSCDHGDMTQSPPLHQKRQWILLIAWLALYFSIPASFVFPLGLLLSARRSQWYILGCFVLFEPNFMWF